MIFSSSCFGSLFIYFYFFDLVKHRKHPIKPPNQPATMKDSERQAILERVKQVEKEELEKIANRMREWEESQKKESSEGKLSPPSSNKKAKPRQREGNRKRKSAELESTSSKSEKSSKEGKAGPTASNSSSKEEVSHRSALISSTIAFTDRSVSTIRQQAQSTPNGRKPLLPSKETVLASPNSCV